MWGNQDRQKGYFFFFPQEQSWMAETAILLHIKEADFRAGTIMIQAAH